MTFKELVDFFFKAKSLKPSTIRMYEYKRKKFEMLSDMEIDEITPIFIEKIYSDLKKANRKYDYDFIFLKSVFSYAVQLELIESNPVKIDLKRAKPSILHELLSLHDLQKLINELSNDNDRRVLSTALLFQLTTGTRVGEVRNLRRKHINMLAHTAIIQFQYGVININGEEGETALKTEYSMRTVYIPDILRKKLYPILKEKSDDDFIFKLKKKPFSILSANSYLKDVCEKLQIVRITTHNLRSLYATMALYSGIPLISVTRQMGHATTRQTERYQRYIKELDKEELKKIDSFFSKKK